MPEWPFDLGGQTFMLQGEHVLRLVVVVVLSGLIGLEREFRDKPAGFRTIILISVGACVFSIVSQAVVGPNVDPTRIAAQIVTGVGFLGAGAILRGRGGVFGMTTAATIWAVAAIGMAVGFGEYMLATAGTASILVVLFLFDAVEKFVGNLRDVQTYHFAAKETDKAVAWVKDLFKDAHLRIIARSWYEDGGAIVFDVVAKGTKADHERLREKLMRSEEYQLRKA